MTMINLLLGFLLSVMLGSFFSLQFEITWPVAEVLFQEPLSAPPLLLVFGTVIHLAILWLYLMRMADTDAKDEAFPPLFLGPTSPPHRALQWECVSAVLGLGLPILGFVWAWGRFATLGQVWIKASGTQVGKWDRVTDCPLFFPPDVGLCRYGKVADRLNPALNGIDFLPFWQPLLMLGLSVAVLAMTVLVLVRLIRRLPARKRMVSAGRRPRADHR